MASAEMLTSMLTSFLKSSYEGHLGKQILDNLKLNSDKIHQINTCKDDKETCGSVRSRMIKTAEALRGKGLKLGDTILISAANHNDTSIPFLASMCIGVIPVNLAVGMTYDEVNHLLVKAEPKLIFSDPSMIGVFKKVVDEHKLNTEIIVFGEKSDCTQFKQFSQVECDEDKFECADFDPAETTAFAACSSGTTGLSKLVAITHRVATIFTLLPIKLQEMQTSLKMNDGGFLCFSPLYWISGIFMVLGSALAGFPRLQCDEPFSPELTFKIVDKYKPGSALLSPVGMYEITKHPDRKNHDYSTINAIIGGGGVISKPVVKDLESLLRPGAKVMIGYGSTEAGGVTVSAGFDKGSIGKAHPWVKWKIVDPDTEEVLGPNKVGELRVQSIMLFQKYFNDPEATRNAFDEENYYKTGDLLYYDEENYLYFTDRCKEVIKYRNYQIAPAELENKIMGLPEIMCVGVVGVPHEADGEIPMAFVEVVPGAEISAQKIKDIIKDSFSDAKQLRGGVVFLDKMPATFSGKINRKELNKMKLTAKGE